ncbi:MAG: hypothetical protein K1X67_21990 [Fimbriimonadaceae bacterium]|nr:hypothetical protein [Fimbriimonadaceae bacterium]
MPRISWIAFFALLLLGSVSCGGSAPQTNPPLLGGKTYSERTLSGASLVIADSVIAALESSYGPALPGDTGNLGTDKWTVRVDQSLDASFGSLVDDVQLSVFDAAGEKLVTARDNTTSIHLEPGTYRLEVENLSTTPKTILVGWRDPRSREANLKTPGVYVTEIDAFPTNIVGVQTAVAAFIGTASYIGPGPAPDYYQIGSYADLTANFATPLDGYLDDAVRLFYINGGQIAYIIPIADESLASHRQGISVVSQLVGVTVQSVSAPDSVHLPMDDWTTFLLEANQAIGHQAVFVADAPKDARALADVPSLQDALAPLIEPSGMVMYFPWILDQNGVAVPPSGALLGIWTANDAERGVWEAPANVAVQGVTAPEIPLTDFDAGQLNVPINGRALCPLLVHIGSPDTMVWGARTMDGNSEDYRYIQTRRSLNYIERSIKVALQSYVFASNDANTWRAVTASISTFLEGFWAEGGLMGNTASDAFNVQCGLGSTMTAQDILNGYMIVQVQLQMIQPAEFIELTFTQTMGS